jgi:hypothetical protein
MDERDAIVHSDEGYSARDIVFGGLFLALAVVVPYLFHVVGGGKLGSVFLPMLLPIAMCGFLTGARVAVVVGATAPLVSSLLTGMPPMYPPIALMMCGEGMLLGGLTSVLYRKVKLNVWISLAAATGSERLFVAFAALVLSRWFSLPERLLSWAAVVYGLPGVALQFAIIPATVKLLEKRIGGGRH